MTHRLSFTLIVSSVLMLLTLKAHQSAPEERLRVALFELVFFVEADFLLALASVIAAPHAGADEPRPS